jgi:hypothetical protein
MFTVHHTNQNQTANNTTGRYAGDDQQTIFIRHLTRSDAAIRSARY